MFKKILFLVLLLSYLISLGQDMSGEKLIDKSIQYHDPNNNWVKFSGELKITMEAPSRNPLISSVFIDLQKEYYRNQYESDSNLIFQVLDKGVCSILFNGKAEFSPEEEKKYRLTCNQAKRTRDYYTYLFGLPMKLKDPGTLINPKIEKRSFRGKEYLVAQVNYKKEVGNDRWYFYFDPITYAMEVYQFYHEESKNDGEYILLAEEIVINGIKMPKNRAWYYNKDDKYLGTDFLFKNSKP